MGKVTLRQHEPVMTPRMWNGEERTFASKVERLFDDLYQRIGTLNDRLKELEAKLEAEETDEDD